MTEGSTLYSLDCVKKIQSKQMEDCLFSYFCINTVGFYVLPWQEIKCSILNSTGDVFKWPNVSHDAFPLTRATSFWLTVTPPNAKSPRSRWSLSLVPSTKTFSVTQIHRCKKHCFSVFFCHCFLASTEVQFYLINSNYPTHLSISLTLINKCPPLSTVDILSLLNVWKSTTHKVCPWLFCNKQWSEHLKEILPATLCGPTFGWGTDPS